jgi:ubiquinone/menaquinone biosynthesis C-methylase UbiE
MSNRSDAWTSDQAYEPYVGRWSRLVAPRFLQWLPPAQPSALWCDVGSGTRVLAHSILASEQPARVLGVDPSPAYLAAAKQGAGDLPIEAVMGSATAIPARTGEFDRVVSALVLCN